MAYLKVRVTPGARQDSIVGWQGDVLRLRVRAAAERGKANDAVCQFVARQLGVPASAISVNKGAASCDKLLAIDGLDHDEIRRRIG